MATLAYLGGVQPSEYRRASYRDNRRLEHELVELHRQHREHDIKIWGEYFKAFVQIVGRLIAR